MSWLKKKKPNPEDGDFPAVPKHYRENGGKKVLTKPVKLEPALEWNGEATVVWGIDVGPQVTTVSFAYLVSGQTVEVHNIVYWPKIFPLPESHKPGEPLPEVKEKTFKLRETYGSLGFVSHPAWTYEKTANYVYIVGAANSPSAFRVRTELPFIEVASERHRYVNLVEYLLKHALSIYGAVIKPGQPQWSCASEIVVSLPSGLSKSAEISVMDALNGVAQRVMPKVIGSTQVYHVSKADLRPFEDDTWRNIDTDFQASSYDWDLTTGDMICTSYKVRLLPSGQVAFDVQQRSYLQSTPVTKKREVSADGKEGVRFANSLHWVAQQKHATQKIIIRASNPFKRSEGLLDSFHKTLTELGLQVGVRLVDSTTETGALGAVLWRIAHVVASREKSNGENVQLVRDVTAAPSMETSPSTPAPSDSELGRSSGHLGVVTSFHTERGSRPVSTAEPSAALVSTPLSWSPPATLPAVPDTCDSQSHNGQEVAYTSKNNLGPSSTPGSPTYETTTPETLPPAYINNDGRASSAN
ncbi:unnamed protein product [Rhizoctonia solani]|uniref:Uncharacterized protein n=1 Tax=Rhizoctonia solani TaxID=456999 RepID=A0A8H3DSN5_9AGAM|nr:unnamed protein product [Rhizoctonia solani]